MSIIDDFPAMSSPETGDEIPIERGTTTYKIDYDALATAIIAKLGGDPVTIAHGGTGLSSAPSMLVDLASAQAASPLAASPRPGVTNTLPLTNGGTGASTAAAALTNLGAAASLFLSSTGWSGLYSELTVIPTNYAALYKCNASTSSKLTAAKVSGITYGVVVRLTNTIFEFISRQGNTADLLLWRVTFESGGANATVGTVCKLTGSEMS